MTLSTTTMVIYSRTKDDADNVSLELVLRNSIKQLKEQQAMAKKNGKKKSERASVSRERRLALVLRAVLDADDDRELTATDESAAAVDLLAELGYSDLKGIPRRLKELNEQLAAALAAGDGKRIAELGLELERAKLGKLPTKSTAPSAAKQSSRKNATTKSTPSTEAAAENVSGVSSGESAAAVEA